MTSKNILIDIDGTICTDMPNEESWNFINAEVIGNSVEWVNELYDAGHTITFFTARTYLHRQITLFWLQNNGFKFHTLITDKPRGGKYFWIDNLDVTGIKYDDNWETIVKSFE
jgi:hypothetical protein|tara:strand:- start:386 stop:724 length:339 start_codon:yes stop_codon:yes gene_type:complete